MSAYVSYRVKDGSQYDLVRAAFQDDLNVSLQKTGFCEEFGLCCERLWRLCAICFPFECGTLEKQKTHINKIILTPQSISVIHILQAFENVFNVIDYITITRQVHICSTAFASILSSALFGDVFSVYYSYPLLTSHLAAHDICILLLCVAKHQTDINTTGTTSRQAFEPRDKEHLEMDVIS